MGNKFPNDILYFMMTCSLLVPSDLVVDQRCMRPPPRRRPGPLGADQRMKLDRVEEASVPCRTGLECREVDYKTYTCKEKATDGKARLLVE